MIRVPDVVACHVNFHLLRDRGQQGGVLKLMKNDHFLVLLAVWFIYPRFLGRLKGSLCYNYTNP